MILFQQLMANRLDLMKLFVELYHLRSSLGDHRIKVISDNSTLNNLLLSYMPILDLKNNKRNTIHEHKSR